MDYKTKKVLSIGAVSELTNLSIRQIRYYEERKLIFPLRTKGGTRQYSFEDVEKLVEISKKLDEGVSTYDQKREIKKTTVFHETRDIMLRGQINAQFNRNK